MFARGPRSRSNWIRDNRHSTTAVFAMIEEFSPLRDGARAIALLLFIIGTCRHAHLISGTFSLRRRQGEPDGSIQWRAKWPRNTGAKASKQSFSSRTSLLRYLSTDSVDEIRAIYPSRHTRDKPTRRDQTHDAGGNNGRLLLLRAAAARSIR